MRYQKEVAKMNQRNVRVEKAEYRFSHGKEPRGRGHWMFEMGGVSGPYSFNGSFADARKAAQREAVNRGQYSVKVMP